MVIPSVPHNFIASSKRFNVYWFIDEKISQLNEASLIHFLDPMCQHLKHSGGGLADGVKAIMSQYNVDTCPLFDHNNLPDFLQWTRNQVKFKRFSREIPKFIKDNIEKGLLAEQKNCKKNSPPKRKFLFEYNKNQPDSLCLGCRTSSTNMKKHPLLEGSLCTFCVDRVCDKLLKKITSVSCCAICGWQFFLITCNNCAKLVCTDCVQFLYGSAKYNSIEKKNFTWDCLFCSPDSLANEIQVNQSMVNKLLQMTASQGIRDWPDQVVHVALKDGTKPPLRVLSLFDGVSSALVVLNTLGIKVEAYFAAEIDEQAIMVSKRNHGEIVTNIGRVEDIVRQRLTEFQPIHLIIGGSPCNDLSRVNHKRKGVFDLDGTGPLFFEFSRIKALVECVQKSPVFFLYENVASMHPHHKDAISRHLEIEPICLDAQNITTMKRERLFWGNIPGMAQMPNRLARASCSITLQDHLTPNLEREACVDKARTVTTNKNSLSKSDGSSQVMMKGQHSTLSINEIEKMFGFPEHYTDVMNLNANARQKLLGKAWSIDVVAALLEPLKLHFKLLEESEKD